MPAADLLRAIPGTSQALRDILDGRRGELLPPIRSEIFGPQRFAEHGRSLGLTHRAEIPHVRVATFYPRLRSNIRTLREAYAYIGQQTRSGYDVSPAAEWLLDNFHLIEAQLKEIHEGLPRSYFRQLPLLLDEPLVGLPRVYGVAWAFVAHTDGAFDEALLVQYLAAYQETRALNLSEMWALPTTLRVVLVENLRRLAERVAASKAARELANLVSDRIDQVPLPALDELLALLEQRGVARVFLAQMAHRRQDSRTRGGDAPPYTGHHDWLSRALPDAAALQLQQNADQTANNLSVSNAVTSLRAIGDADWSGIVAHSSVLMREMLRSPMFEAEHATTRDSSLHGIEQLAQRSGRSEVAVAQALLGLMQNAQAAQPAAEAAEAAEPEHALAAAPSHWLQGAGRPALLRAIGLARRAPLPWRRVLRRIALPAYLGALLFGSAGLVAWMMARHLAGPAWLTALAAALMLLPASEAVVAAINRLISESVRPQHLPRLALADGIPPEHRVMVAMPALLTSEEGLEALAHRLLLHHLANPERHAQFALLTDGADAATPQLDSDAALLASAVRRIDALNQRHPVAEGEPPRFIVLHRERRFSESEQRWIGWERKRGKLEQLIGALADSTQRPFIDLGAASRIAEGTRYVVTLDSDTQLPPGRLRELVGVAAHPQNQPRLDAGGRRVVGGYGILQPHVATPLPAPHEATLYHALFAGQCGIDPYSAASSEVYQDVFGEGSFTGKGLLHVQAMHTVLAGRLPEGQVLSHDLLEGSIARCAAVTDIALIEDAPFHADVAASRVHRWTRGDWQLLPILLQPRRYPLRAINRWKMLDNLRRSLVAPVSLALLLMALAGFEAAPISALALVLLAYSAGPLIGAFAGLWPSRDDVAKRHFYREAALDLLRALCGGLWHLTLLLRQSMLAIDAIGRALYRTTVSRRHLLQWTTAAAAQAAAKTRLADLLRVHWLLPAGAALLLGFLLVVGTPAPGLALLLCLAWAASPLAIWWASRPRPAPARATITAAQRQYLHGVARDTWRFFERCVGPEDNHLPPDNLQTLPNDMVAHRTSPTNIGLYLLSAACARQFGWIDTEQLLARLEATLATLHTLRRHRGHFLNWYDTQSRAPLLPMYLSTVDSGNLCGHLLAVAQACLELAHPPRAALATVSADPGDAARARLQQLAQAFEQFAGEADFGFLHHRRRHLFHIGYRVEEQQLDAGFYDLLASESRLTSLLAIAKGDVPVQHWASLGRPFFADGSQAGLRSWSGSMFEYLMPGLVLAEPQGSVLHAAAEAALHEQMRFARARDVPWGISESAYAGRDHTLAYQYAPQGVPSLALRRAPPDELVVAPYATALAAQIVPRLACLNFEALEALGARGQYGFIEALDYTPSRQAGDEVFTPVATFMSHHQGMSIVALANLLLGAPAQRWAGAHAPLEAVASLLHERLPREVSLLNAPLAAPPQLAAQRRAPAPLRHVLPGASAVEPTHVLSNGRYSVALRANGAGFSRCGSVGITRWRDDALRDAHGSFFFLRHSTQPRPVSITQHPAPDAAAHYRAVFHADRVCFDAAWPELQAHVTVWVSPEDDIEFRQVELRNLGERAIEIELISAFEVTLADPLADESHPAFSNLFVTAQWLPSHQALWFERKPRLATEQGLQAAHFLAASDPQVRSLHCQTDRQRWAGRNQDASRPLAALDPVPREAAALDTGLDPVCALSVRLRIEARGKAELTFATAASADGDRLRAVVDKYRHPNHVERASLMSATLAGIRLRELRINAENFAAIQSLCTALLFSLTRPRIAAMHADPAAREACDRRALWRFGLSGDRPILLVSAGVTQGLGLLRALAQALRLWSWGAVACDLVVVNAEAASYQPELHRELAALRDRYVADSQVHDSVNRAGFHLLRADELSADELSTLQIHARVWLQADGRPLAHHVQEWLALHDQAGQQRDAVSSSAVALARGPAASVPAPSGAFVPGSGAFRFEVSAGQRPKRPWINVLANPGFGCQLSEAGGGYTWARNSRSMQLTAWSNDPVADPPAECFLLQDCSTLQVWSAAPSASGDDAATYRVTHGPGWSAIGHRRGDLDVTASWCVDTQAAIKQVRLRLVNRGHRSLRLRIVGIAEWMMGARRADRGTVRTALHQQRLGGPGERARNLTALLCTQRETSEGFGGATAFLALSGSNVDDSEGEAIDDWTCDRRELFDARGRLVLPDHFGQRRGAGLDPCAALSTRFVLPAGETAERVFLLGHADNPDAARELVNRAAPVDAETRLQAGRAAWDSLLGATTVSTPDPLFDVLVNRWLLYQAVACRLWAKAGFYQAGGATGFRDQLQDAMALAWARPALLREQILLCASRQFVEGDVQHWWHAPAGAGVRTHFSDDLLWLPHACAHYLNSTGDSTLLDADVPFIEGAPIPPGAEDAYTTPSVSASSASVYEHAARAIDRSLRVGAQGLPLMGSGDWNDGMNRVGHEGRGQSVWLGWFLCRIVADFAPLAHARGDTARALRWGEAAQGWKAALLGPAWDGQWFKRAFFDDGHALGSHTNSEARIDLIAQAWAVLSNVAPADLQRQALAAMDALLVDQQAGLIRLLDPPLAQSVPSAGYIQAYPPGVRENGGQYSHAGVWALMAQAQASVAGVLPAAVDGGALVYRYFTYLSPAHRAADAQHGAAYGIEPYVVAGDVYSAPPHVGRGGWSWYTGAAGWLRRAAIESMFGLRIGPHELSFTPCLPPHWPRAELTLRRDGRTMRFILLRAGVQAARDAAAAARAQLLRPGQALHWSGLAPDTCFVVPLLDADVATPVAALASGDAGP